MNVDEILDSRIWGIYGVRMQGICLCDLQMGLYCVRMYVVHKFCLDFLDFSSLPASYIHTYTPRNKSPCHIIMYAILQK